MKAVTLLQGRLTEVEIPELAAFRRQGFSWSTVKGSTTVSRSGFSLTYLVGGWYLENGDPVQRSQGDTRSLGFFPRNVTVAGPLP